MLEIANECFGGIGWLADDQGDVVYVYSAQDNRPDIWDYPFCMKLATEVAAEIVAVDPESADRLVVAVEVNDGDWCLAQSHGWVIDDADMPFVVASAD